MLRLLPYVIGLVYMWFFFWLHGGPNAILPMRGEWYGFPLFLTEIVVGVLVIVASAVQVEVYYKEKEPKQEGSAGAEIGH